MKNYVKKNTLIKKAKQQEKRKGKREKENGERGVDIFNYVKK